MYKGYLVPTKAIEACFLVYPRCPEVRPNENYSAFHMMGLGEGRAILLGSERADDEQYF
jgi:hypothetical protein